MIASPDDELVLYLSMEQETGYRVAEVRHHAEAARLQMRGSE